MLLWHNGEFAQLDEPRLSPLAAGTLLGLGAFTTIGVWNGRPFVLERHLARLRSNLAALGMENPYTDEVLSDALNSLLQPAGIVRGMARITVTARGDGRWLSAEGCDVSITAQPIEHENIEPLRLTLSPYRIEPRRATTGIKCTSYTDALLAWREANSRGYDEAVLCHSSGVICEGARSNLFWVRGARLSTPSLECGPLPGITRQLVLDWARNSGMLVREGAFSLADLSGADEVFTTSSTFGPRPVCTLDEDSYAAPGPLTARLMDMWARGVELSAQ